MFTATKFRDLLTLAGYQGLFGLSFLSAGGLIPLVSRYPGRVREGFHQYLGGFEKSDHRPLIWVHGVSLGESLVAVALMKQWREKFPGTALGFSSTDPQVLATIRSKGLADYHAFFPLDFLPFLKRAFDRWRPEMVVLVETDFWPAFSFYCQRKKIPLVLVNGRISEKHRAFYSRFQSLGRTIFKAFACLGVQSEADQKRLKEMGARMEDIKILGNIKFDLNRGPAPAPPSQISSWKGTDSLAVFGSLHPLEFHALKEGFCRLAEGGVKLLIAPRNISFAAEWCSELKKMGFDAALRTSLPGTAFRGKIVLLDSFGELASCYSLGEVAFVGGTLDPSVGGHNPLEPLNQGIPVVMGPHARNFRELVQELEKHQGVDTVSQASEVCPTLMQLLKDEMARKSRVAGASKVIEGHLGALQRTLGLLEALFRKNKFLGAAV